MVCGDVVWVAVLVIAVLVGLVDYGSGACRLSGSFGWMVCGARC